MPTAKRRPVKKTARRPATRRTRPNTKKEAGILGSRALGGKIAEWQGPGQPAISHVGSYWISGHPVAREQVEAAIAEMSRNYHSALDVALHVNRNSTSLRDVVAIQCALWKLLGKV